MAAALILLALAAWTVFAIRTAKKKKGGCGRGCGCSGCTGCKQKK